MTVKREGDNQMTNLDNSSTQQSSGPKAGWICLAIGILLFILPIPMFGLGILIAGGLCTAALILAIVSMNKGTGGLALLLSTLIGSPIAYVLSWFTWMLSLT